jgi:amidohydrolase
VVTGAGGHAAMPDACVDPIVIASEIVVALQTVVSRNVGPADSAVVSVTQFHAGTADNVIPDRVTLRGTIRTFDPRVQQRVLERVRVLATGIAAAHGGSADVRCAPGYPVLKNDAGLTAKLPELAAGIEGLRVVELPLLGGGEDFAYYTEKLPGLFAFLGARNEAIGCRYPHHHAKFNIDERALPQGTALHIQYCLQAGMWAAG